MVTTLTIFALITIIFFVTFFGIFATMGAFEDYLTKKLTREYQEYMMAQIMEEIEKD